MLWVCVIQGWGLLCEPMWCDSEALCMCLSSDVSLLHSTSQL